MSVTFMHRLLCAASASLAAACASPGAPADRALRLNDIQIIGSHNSYRRAPDAEGVAAIAAARPGLAEILAYEHPPLARQLDLGVRQFELDVFAPPESVPEDEAPGFRVMHLPGLDDESHCPRLADCLGELRAWSRAHPGHLPVIITIDAKDRPFGISGVAVPRPLTPALLEALDRELVEGLGRARLITPDDVRRRHPTLRDAVRAGGWPTLEAARGRFMVIFDVRPGTAELYRQGRPSLAGRAMFSLYGPGEPEAATFVVQDPRGEDQARIRGLVRDGFFVRTRSDANTVEARTGDRSMLEAAAASGAQVISTDYYPGAPDPLGLGFVVTLPDGDMARCNPVRRARACRLSPRPDPAALGKAPQRQDPDAQPVG